MISLIKDNQKYFNRLHVVLDGLVIVATYALAWYVRFQTGFNNDAEFTGVLSAKIYFSTLLYIVPGYLILNYWVIHIQEIFECAAGHCQCHQVEYCRYDPVYRYFVYHQAEPHIAFDDLYFLRI